MDFDKYASKGNEVLNTLAEDLQIPRDKASRILRAVLYAIRNHLSIQESLQVISQLPMALKGIYVDQWSEPHVVSRIHHVKQFLDEVREFDKGTAGYDLGNDESAGRAVQAVFRTLNNYISDGEFEDMIAFMPVEIKEFIRKSIEQGRIKMK
jgi:uncharacterized protein (DUF2267 family)